MKKFKLLPKAAYDLVIAKIFADILPTYTGTYNGVLGEFTVADDVPLSTGKTLISLFAKGMQLKRKDGSCKTDWSTMAVAGTEKIFVTELYGAIEDCQEEFYTGALKDYAELAPKFRDFVLTYFQKLLRFDLAVNSYFGDINRAADPNGKYSWNMFDGIFTHYQKAAVSGRLPSSQLLSIPDGEINPVDAFGIFQDMYDAQDEDLDTEDDNAKAYYVNKKLAKAYWRYMRSLGQTTKDLLNYVMDGIPVLSHEGIPIFVEPIWDPVIKSLNGGVGHAAVLCKRGSWVFGTNSKYGGGPNKNEALRVWWSDDDEVWRQKAHMVAGTQVMGTEHAVVATSF